MNLAEAYYQAFLETNNFAEVARRFGVSRAYVHKVLRNSGYDIPKRQKRDLGYVSVKLSIPEEYAQKLKELSDTTYRPLSHHLEKAIEHYIDNKLYEVAFDE